MPYKTWQVGELVTAADLQSFVQNQTVGVYADAAARDAAIAVPVEGMHAWLTGPQLMTVYTAGSWVHPSRATEVFWFPLDYVSAGGVADAAFTVDITPFGFTAAPVASLMLEATASILGQHLVVSLNSRTTATTLSVGMWNPTNNMNAKTYRFEVQLAGSVADVAAARALNGTLFTGS